MHALEVTDLTVKYGTAKVAVDRLSLTVAPGAIVGLLGPNGAGKSTAMLAIAGGLLPTGGRIAIAGVDLAADPIAAKRQLGFADQPPSLYEFFTVDEHIEMISAVRGRADPAAEGALLNELGLAGIREKACRELSFGMRQRVGLAAALVAEPALILLDETLNGLDPHAARRARKVVLAAAARGAAILMSTHLLDVAERMCSRIVVMDQGKIVADLDGDALAAQLAAGPGALEELYVGKVADGGVT